MMKNWNLSQRVFSAGVFPAALAASVALTLAAPANGWRPDMALMTVFALSIVLVRLSEAVVPYNRQWQQRQGGDTWMDATSLVVMMAAVDPMLKAFWPIAAAALWSAFGPPQAGALFGESVPLFLKVPLALLISGLGEYAAHRLSHQWAPMWRVHALHHSAGRIYWLNAFRAHPVNIVWNQLVGYFILMLLGVDALTLAVAVALSITVSAFQHANAQLTHGPLNYIFSTNELHRWHHDSRPGRSFVNFGSVLTVWDLVFRSFHHVPSATPGEPGLEAGPQAAAHRGGYWRQVVLPLRAWFAR